MTIPWWFAGILASVCITWVEYLNRTATTTNFLDQLRYTGAFILIAQLFLFEAFRKTETHGADSLIVAWVLVSVTNVIFRVANSHIFLDEPVSLIKIAGILVVLFGAYLVKLG